MDSNISNGSSSDHPSEDYYDPLGRNEKCSEVEINHLKQKLNVTPMMSCLKLEKKPTIVTMQDIGHINSNYQDEHCLETETKKQDIINKSLHFIFMELPKHILKLDELLKEIRGICTKHQRLILERAKDGLIEKMNRKTILNEILHNKKVNDETLPAIGDHAKVIASLDDKKLAEKNLLENICSHHFSPTTLASGQDAMKFDCQLKHNCSDSYTFERICNLFKFEHIPTGKEVLEFSNKLRSLFVKLGKHFLNVELGFSLMFPKSESNEEANKSLQILEQLLVQVNSVSIDLNIFEDWVEGRAELVKKLFINEHFGESWYLLHKFDADVCNKFKYLIEKLITQYLTFYDLFVMNIDSIVSVKNKNNPKTSSSSAASTNNYNGIFS